VSNLLGGIGSDAVSTPCRSNPASMRCVSVKKLWISKPAPVRRTKASETSATTRMFRRVFCEWPARTPGVPSPDRLDERRAGRADCRRETERDAAEGGQSHREEPDGSIEHD